MPRNGELNCAKVDFKRKLSIALFGGAFISALIFLIGIPSDAPGYLLVAIAVSGFLGWVFGLWFWFSGKVRWTP